MASTLIRIDGLDDAGDYFKRFPKRARRAARLAINTTARRQRTAAARAIRDQVALKASYVNRNLRLTELASEASLTAVIHARSRPVQLSRYGAKQLTRKAEYPSRSTGDPLRGIPAGRKAAGVSVRVKKGGQRKKMRGAFLIPLNNTDRLGLATRTGPAPDDYQIEHGPSVAQVFRDVREQIAPDTQGQLSREYRRQLSRFL